MRYFKASKPVSVVKSLKDAICWVVVFAIMGFIENKKADL
jgi:hypothetical protein